MSNSKQKPKGNNEAEPVVDEVVEPALNEDGLVAGQEISFYDLLRIKSEQRNKEAE